MSQENRGASGFIEAMADLDAAWRSARSIYEA